MQNLLSNVANESYFCITHPMDNGIKFTIIAPNNVTNLYESL